MLLVALLCPALLVLACAAVPAVLLLPFRLGGTGRAVRLIGAVGGLADRLLAGSLEPPAAGSPPAGAPGVTGPAPAPRRR